MPRRCGSGTAAIRRLPLGQAHALLGFLRRDAVLPQELASPLHAFLRKVGRLGAATAWDQALIGQSIQDVKIGSLPATPEFAGPFGSGREKHKHESGVAHGLFLLGHQGPPPSPDLATVMPVRLPRQSLTPRRGAPRG